MLQNIKFSRYGDTRKTEIWKGQIVIIISDGDEIINNN